MADVSLPKRIALPDFVPVTDIADDSVSYETVTVDGKQEFEDKISIDNLIVNGDAVFHEFVDSGRIGVTGNASFIETVTCDEFLCEGLSVMKRNLICQDAGFYGESECYGTVHAARINVTGGLKVSGKIDSIDIGVSGKLRVSGKIVCDNLQVSGDIKTRSSIRTIDFKLVANGTVSEAVGVIAENVDISSKVKDPSEYVFSCDSIECDIARLSYTDVDTVFCEEAHIGDGCHVRVLECKDEPEISLGARVDKILRF